MPQDRNSVRMNHHGRQVEQNGVELGLARVAQRVPVGRDEAVLHATVLALKRIVSESDPPINLKKVHRVDYFTQSCNEIFSRVLKLKWQFNSFSDGQNKYFGKLESSSAPNHFPRLPFSSFIETLSTDETN